MVGKSTSKKSESGLSDNTSKSGMTRRAFIRGIVRLAGEYAFYLFGGAVRDQLSKDVPLDLDFVHLPRYSRRQFAKQKIRYTFEETQEYKRTCDALISSLSNDYNIDLKEVPHCIYPMDFSDIHRFKISSKDESQTIDVDLIPPELFCCHLDLDVNGLYKIGKRIHAHPSIDLESTKRNCRRRRFRPLLENSDSNCYSTICIHFDNINEVLLSEYRTVKLLNRGWELGLSSSSNEELVPSYTSMIGWGRTEGIEKDSEKSEKNEKSDCQDETIKTLVHNNHLIVNVKGEPLLRLRSGNNEDICFVCSKALKDKYVHGTRCCGLQLHVRCSKDYFRRHLEERRYDSIFLNCPQCGGDPFGWKTSGPNIPGLLRIHINPHPSFDSSFSERMSHFPSENSPRCLFTLRTNPTLDTILNKSKLIPTLSAFDQRSGLYIKDLIGKKNDRLRLIIISTVRDVVYSRWVLRSEKEALEKGSDTEKAIRIKLEWQLYGGRLINYIPNYSVYAPSVQRCKRIVERMPDFNLPNIAVGLPTGRAGTGNSTRGVTLKIYSLVYGIVKTKTY